MFLRLLLDDDASSSTRCTGKRAVETAQTKIMDRGLCPAGGGRYGPQSRAGVVCSHPTSIPRRREWCCWCARLASGRDTAAAGYGAEERPDWSNGVGSTCHYYSNMV